MSTLGSGSASGELRVRLSHNLKRLRKARGLAQERLALEAGVDRTMLSKIERRLANPSLDTLLKLALGLGVDIVELLNPTSSAVPGLLHEPVGRYESQPKARPRGPGGF